MGWCVCALFLSMHYACMYVLKRLLIYWLNTRAKISHVKLCKNSLLNIYLFFKLYSSVLQEKLSCMMFFHVEFVELKMIFNGYGFVSKWWFIHAYGLTSLKYRWTVVINDQYIIAVYYNLCIFMWKCLFKDVFFQC